MAAPRTIEELEQLIADLREDLNRPPPAQSQPGAWAARQLCDDRDRRALKLAEELLAARRWLTGRGIPWEGLDTEDVIVGVTFE